MNDSEIRLLITGASGFVGKQVVARLVPNIELHCALRNPQNALGRKVVQHKVDLLDLSECERLMASVRPTHLLHLAWITEHGRFWSHSDNRRWFDAGVVLVQSFARHGGARIVVAGTCAEYSPSASSPLDEFEASVAPESLYGKWKNELRLVVQAIAEETGISWAWARLFNLYGPAESPQRLVPSVIQALIRNQKASCSSGKQVRDFMDVRDAALALLALLTSSLQGPINLGSGQRSSIADIARTIGRLMGRNEMIELGTLPNRVHEPRLQVPALARMRDQLGYVPTIEIEAGLKNAIDWWSQPSGPAGQS